MIRRVATLLLLLLAAMSTQATEPASALPDGKTVMAYGKPDGAVPGWSIVSVPPAGWTADCCQYARAIGVNLVLYKGDWSGDPDRVMVLNVWPSKLPTLAAEWKADQAHYLKRDPLAKVAAFALKHPSMPCHGLLYRGTDHIDDVVVFCDPGKAAGVRLSWSMTVAAEDRQREQVMAMFRDVVGKSVYKPYRQTPEPASRAALH
ncbi:MAG TPA: hypothetical protein VGC19_07965 [Rhodanobacter sp.]